MPWHAQRQWLTERARAARNIGTTPAATRFPADGHPRDALGRRIWEQHQRFAGHAAHRREQRGGDPMTDDERDQDRAYHRAKNAEAYRRAAAEQRRTVRTWTPCQVVVDAVLSSPEATPAEIAGSLGITVATCRNSLYRADRPDLARLFWPAERMAAAEAAHDVVALR